MPLGSITLESEPARDERGGAMEKAEELETMFGTPPSG